MPKIQENKNRFFVTIPKDYIKLAGWKKGEEVAIYPLEKGKLIIQKV